MTGDTPRTKKWSRLPTVAELDAFDGLHCSQAYRKAVASGWRCPCCGRSAKELVRWTKIGSEYFRKLHGDAHGMGFSVSIVEHHCHAYRRFDRATICGDCNSADGAVKRKLKLPESWSFSPAEIKRFVKMKIHSGETLIDYEEARRIYEALRPLFWDTPPLR